MNKQSRAEKANNGAHRYICDECADEYRLPSRIASKGSRVYHNGECYICERQTMITSSKKLLGLSIPHD